MIKVIMLIEKKARNDQFQSLESITKITIELLERNILMDLLSNI